MKRGAPTVHNVMLDPALGGLLFNLLALWPLARVFRRVGLSPWWAALVLVPVAGPLLVIVVLGLSRWPLLPRLPRPPKKVRRVAP